MALSPASEAGPLIELHLEGNLVADAFNIAMKTSWHAMGGAAERDPKFLRRKGRRDQPCGGGAKILARQHRQRQRTIDAGLARMETGTIKLPAIKRNGGIGMLQQLSQPILLDLALLPFGHSFKFLNLAQAARQTGMSLRFSQRQNYMCVQYSHSCFPLPARGRRGLSIFTRFYESVFPGRLGGNRVSGHNCEAAFLFQVRLHASPKFFFSALAVTVAGDDFQSDMGWIGVE